MLYTIAQLSALLRKVPKTIYNEHVTKGIGTLHETEEGRRLLFTELEYQYLQKLFDERQKERLLAKPNVGRIVDLLKKTPMTVYDVARKLKMAKSTAQSLLASMSFIFDELEEDQRGILYFGNKPLDVKLGGDLVRHVFLSDITGDIICWYTFADVTVPPDSSYTLLMTDMCLYEQDMRGKLVYEHDIICANGVYALAVPPIPKEFRIVGNIHTTWIPSA
jgi:hypothetical protein